MKKIIAVMAFIFFVSHPPCLRAQETKSINDLAATVPDGMVFRKRLEDAKRILNPNGKKLAPNETIEEAKKMLDQNLFEDPTHAPTYLELAHYYLLKDDVKQAEGSLNQAIRIFPAFHEAQFVRAQLHLKAGEFAEARLIKNIGMVTMKDELSFPATIEFVKLLAQFKDKDKENVLSYIELAVSKAVTDSEKSMAQSTLGDYYLASEDYPKCVEYKEKAVFFDLENAVENASLAECYLKVKKYEQAYRSAEKSLEVVSSEKAKTVYLEAIDNLVKQYNQEGRTVNAHELLLKSIKINSKNLKTYLELSRAQIKMQKNDDAVKSIKAAIELDEEKIPSIVSHLSKTYKEKSDDFAEFMNKLLNDYKESPALAQEIVYQTANSFELLNKKTEAVAWITKGKEMMAQPTAGRSPASETADESVLKANFSLLELKIDNNKLSELEDANNYFKEAKRREHDNPKVIVMEETLNQVNTKFGRSPASIIWKAKLFLSKYIPVTWMNF